MSAYSALILAKASLSAYWRMADTSGAVLTDSSANAIHGTLGSGWATTTGSLVNDSNAAIAFDGTADAAGGPDHNLLDLGDGPFWIAFWFKRSATQGANQTILNKGTNAYQVRFTTANTLQLLVNGGQAAAATAAITDQNWHFAVVNKVSGGAATIYVDGVDATASATTRTFADTTTGLLIARAAAATQRFVGELDELAIGKGATLSASEILELWRVGRGLIGEAAEADTAQALDADKAKTPTSASETDTAQALVYAKPIQKTLTPATESEAAETFNADKSLSVASASETDEAQALGRGDAQNVSITPAQEADAAQALSFTQGTPAPTPTGRSPHVGLVWQPERKPKVMSIMAAGEIDIAWSLTYTKAPSQIQIEDDELLAVI